MAFKIRINSAIPIERLGPVPANPVARLLADVRQPRHERVEFSKNPFFEELLGQIVREEAILVAGAPGSNKSTLSRQLAIDLAANGRRTLFILTEENPERLKSAILKMTSDWSADDVKKVLSNLHVETALHDVLMLPGFLTQAVVNPGGAYHGVDMVVIDSIQGPGLSANDFERWQALFQATALTRAARVMTLLVCHATKSGEIAGPKALQHAVDATVLIRKAYNRRQIAVLKNRFGPETARPMQLELESTTVTLRPCPHAETLTAVARGYPNVINLQNGTLELDTLRLRPHDSSDRLTKLAGAAFDTNGVMAMGGDDAEWNRFLSKVIPNADVRHYLQRAVGYSLTSSVAEEKLFLLFGGGRNGKTTFVNAIRYVLGDYAMEGDQQLLTYKAANMKGANSDATADLVGRRFVAVSETADGDRLDEAKVKALVSNKPINAMRKYERAFMFNPSHKLWIDTNHKPKVRGVDDGIWRRIAIIPFDVQIQLDDIDAKLREKLEADCVPILRWALDGLREYRAKGLTEPTTIRRATAEYRSDSDTLRLFVAECVGRDDGANVGKSAMFAAYRRWLDANGYAFNLTAPAFNARLIELGFSEMRTSAGRYWRDRYLLDNETTNVCERRDEASPFDDDNRNF